MNEYDIARREVTGAFDKLREQEAKDPLAMTALTLGETAGMMLISMAESLNRIATTLEKEPQKW